MLRTPSPPMADCFESYVSTRQHVLIRFGKWHEIIAMMHYAKGVAHAALGDVPAAEADRSGGGFPSAGYEPASVMRRLSLNRSEPAKKSGQNIPKNRCRTTIAERMVETLAELPFIGDQVGLFRAQPSRPKRRMNAEARSRLGRRPLGDRRERFLGHPAGLQKRREVAPLAQLGDTQLDGARAGLPIALAVAVAVVDPVGAALAVAGPGQALDLQLHQAP